MRRQQKRDCVDSLPRRFGIDHLAQGHSDELKIQSDLGIRAIQN